MYILIHTAVTTFKITEIKSFNYDIAASAEQQTITFTVKSRDIVWSLLQIQFILHARDDLFSQLNQLSTSIHTQIFKKPIKPQKSRSLFLKLNLQSNTGRSIIF